MDGKPLSIAIAFVFGASTVALAQGQQQRPGAGQVTGPVRVEMQQSQAYGQYLTDGQGRALYMFTADSKESSSCYDACAAAWPPLLTRGQPSAGQQVNELMLGTLQRRDGGMQVTYNGMPLYYFARDQAAGSATGQDVKGFGGEWYLVSPQGEKVKKGEKGG